MFKLIAIGDNNIDTYAASGVSYPGGNCPNVAAYAAINGYPSAYIGVAGLDSFGTCWPAGLPKPAWTSPTCGGSGESPPGT